MAGMSQSWRMGFRLSCIATMHEYAIGAGCPPRQYGDISGHIACRLLDWGMPRLRRQFHREQ